MNKLSSQTNGWIEMDGRSYTFLPLIIYQVDLALEIQIE
jgi:hypothetical protein